MKNYDYIEPIHEWFDCICKNCGETLPDSLNKAAGGQIHDGDKCPNCGAVLQEHEDLKEVLKGIAERHKFSIRPGRLEPMVLKFEQQLDKYGDMYCPCQLQQTKDTICPCRYMRTNGACRCGLFMQTEGAKNWTTM